VSRWRDPVVLVLVTRLLWLGVGAASLMLLSGVLPDLAVWRVWDADIYARIAEQGYTGPDAEPYSEAFLPLLPLLLRALTTVGMDVVRAGLLISLIASLVAVRALVTFGDEQHGEGRRAALYLLVFPTAHALVAGYTEALFLAGAVPAALHARRGDWRRVAPGLAVATTTRLTGLFLVSGLLAELLVRQRDRWRAGLTWIAVGSLPFLAYAGWLWRVHGTPLYLVQAQTEGWGRGYVGPVAALRTTWYAARSEPDPHLALTWSLEIVAAAVLVATLVAVIRRRDWLWIGYVGPMTAVLLTSTWYFSLPRMLLTVVPLFLLLAEWSARRPHRHELVLLVSLPLATLGVASFVRGTWWF